MAKITFKNDQYKSARGGYSKLLDISCEKCGAHVCYYQKDGPGNLRRMYLDRMYMPTTSVKKKELSCPNTHVLGIKINYVKESRPAFRLFVDAIVKKIVRADSIKIK